MKTSGTDRDKRHTLQWWMVPKRDEHGQWWWGYQKVYIKVLPQEDKLAYLKKISMRLSQNK